MSISSADSFVSAREPFDAEKIVDLWTQLLTLQVNLGYYSSEEEIYGEPISFPPAEGRSMDEALCTELALSERVIALMKRLPCPSSFDVAWDMPVFNESMAVPFTESESIRSSRDLERLCGGAAACRQEYMSPDDLALVVDKDETGYHLILDTKESKS